MTPRVSDAHQITNLADLALATNGRGLSHNNVTELAHYVLKRNRFNALYRIVEIKRSKPGTVRVVFGNGGEEIACMQLTAAIVNHYDKTRKIELTGNAWDQDDLRPLIGHLKRCGYQVVI
jgi:hypothetical protein